MSVGEADVILNGLSKVFSGISGDELDRAAGKILSHDRVFFYGAGRSGLMVKALAMRLMQAGRTVYVVGETVTPSVGPGDMLCVASASGRTESVLRYAEKAKACGADVMVITAAKDSPLTGISPADIELPVPAEHGQVLGSVFEQALLILGDILMLRMRPDETAMRARHANLE